MDYATAIERAPAGWRHFKPRDVDRLPSAVRGRELARIPLRDRALAERGDPAAVERTLKALFWTLVYHLEPERWHELERCEPIHPDLLAALPETDGVTVDVGAGSGRLTEHLARRAGRVVAVEPSLGLCSILAGRVPRARIVASWAEALPLAGHSVKLTAACCSFGPEPSVLAELQRVTAPGGGIALINPEQPEWFEARGWSRVTTRPLPVPHHAAWIDAFFGPPDPPTELVLLRIR